MFDNKKTFNAFVAHKWHIIKMPEAFNILAKSGDTIEAVKHTTKPLYGFQFHPEVIMDGNEGTEIFRNILRSLQNK
jgi:anthranilate/para-aminobenzoate synthase component II